MTTQYSLEAPLKLNKIALVLRTRLARAALAYEDISLTFGTFSWMAQCARRIRYPLDASERSGLPAFEYGWKAFNALYGTFTCRGERKKIGKCLALYLPDKRDFVIATRDHILRACDVLLAKDCDSGFDSGIDNKDLLKTIRRAKLIAGDIKEKLDDDRYDELPKQLAMLLYEFRNARVHGDYLIAGSHRERIISGEPYILESALDFTAFPPVLLEMLYWLMGNKTTMSREYMENIVDAFLYHFVSEIRRTVVEEWRDEDMNRLCAAFSNFG